MNREELIREVLKDGLVLAVLSGRRDPGPEKIRIRPVIISGEVCYQAEYVEENKAYHKNLKEEELLSYLDDDLLRRYRQLQIKGNCLDGTVLISKKGKLTVKTKRHEQTKPPKIAPHNRVRNYILKEGAPVPFLIDLGVMTAEGKVVAAKYDKFRQINRFLEYIRDILPYLPEGRTIRVLDFGCGKSYLTFAVYYYLHELLGRDISVTGLDLKADVIKKCSDLAGKYGYSELHFRVGDVADFDTENTVDLMVTLHACDTATDYALYKAALWKAGVILSVPCCQHELNRQIKGELLEPVLGYGILKERISALLTDGIRAELLKACGYNVQLLEFIDMEHTPKNILIRAVKDAAAAGKDIDSLQKMMQSLHLDPTLYRLLAADNLITGEQNEEDTSQTAHIEPGLCDRDHRDSSAFE